MIAFEILMNGKRLYTMGAGPVGVINAAAKWMRLITDDGTLLEHAVFVGGTSDGTLENVQVWPVENLQVGDEITVRMIESDSCDPPPGQGRQPGQAPPWLPHQSRF